MKKPFLLVSILAIIPMAGCSQTLTAEPGPGRLGYNAKVLVDDGTCPAGQIKQVTGGNGAIGVPRKRECIEKPA